jgi:hypothetical protein
MGLGVAQANCHNRQVPIATPFGDHTSAGRAVVPAFRVEDPLKDIDKRTCDEVVVYSHSSRTPLALL